MAVAITRLDGQNTGLRLLGQLSVNPLSLNLTTGEVTSAYLLPTDCVILQEFALTLFQIVPISGRSAAAIGLLSRLCAVSPADSSTVTLSASVAAGVATLTATVGASPAALVLTIPYSPSGGVMPSGGGGGSPGPGADSNLVEILLGEVMNPGDPVAIDSGLGYIAKAGTVGRMPAIGVIDSLVDPVTAKVRVAGVLTSGSGYTEGQVHFVTAAGTISTTPPSVSGELVQAIGFGIDSNTLAVAPSAAITIR